MGHVAEETGDIGLVGNEPAAGERAVVGGIHGDERDAGTAGCVHLRGQQHGKLRTDGPALVAGAQDDCRTEPARAPSKRVIISDVTCDAPDDAGALFNEVLSLALDALRVFSLDARDEHLPRNLAIP